jgi:hypothetical protein
MNHIGLFKFGQGGDVRTRVGYVYGKQVVFPEAVGHPDHEPLPYEIPDIQPAAFQLDDADIFRLFITNEEFSFDTMILQCYGETPGRDGCSSNAFGCID